MISKYVKTGRKERLYNIGIDTFIERLRKIRALNCSPSDVGIDSYICKKLSVNRVTRFL